MSTAWLAGTVPCSPSFRPGVSQKVYVLFALDEMLKLLLDSVQPDGLEDVGATLLRASRLINELFPAPVWPKTTMLGVKGLATMVVVRWVILDRIRNTYGPMQLCKRSNYYHWYIYW